MFGFFSPFCFGDCRQHEVFGTEKQNRKKDIKNLESVQKDLVKWATGLEGMS